MCLALMFRFPLFPPVTLTLKIFMHVSVCSVICSLIGMYPQEMEASPHKNSDTNAYSSIIRNSLKIETNPKRPLRAEWISTMSCSHTVEYYTAGKRNEVLIHTVVWMSLNSFILSESQTQNTKCCMNPFIENVCNRQVCRDRKQISDRRGLEMG